MSGVTIFPDCADERDGKYYTSVSVLDRSLFNAPSSPSRARSDVRRRSSRDPNPSTTSLARARRRRRPRGRPLDALDAASTRSISFVARSLSRDLPRVVAHAPSRACKRRSRRARTLTSVQNRGRSRVVSFTVVSVALYVCRTSRTKNTHARTFATGDPRPSARAFKFILGASRRRAREATVVRERSSARDRGAEGSISSMTRARARARGSSKRVKT